MLERRVRQRGISVTRTSYRARDTLYISDTFSISTFVAAISCLRISMCVLTMHSLDCVSDFPVGRAGVKLRSFPTHAAIRPPSVPQKSPIALNSSKLICWSIRFRRPSRFSFLRIGSLLRRRYDILRVLKKEPEPMEKVMASFCRSLRYVRLRAKCGMR